MCIPSRICICIYLLAVPAEQEQELAVCLLAVRQALCLLCNALHGTALQFPLAGGLSAPWPAAA